LNESRTTATQLTRWWDAEPSAAFAPTTSEQSSGGLAFRALLTFTFILLISPQGYFPILTPLRIAYIAALVAIVAHVGGRWQLGQALGVIPEVRLALALLGWSFLSVPFSYWPGGSLSFLFEVYVKAIIVFWLLAGCVDDPRRLHRTVWALSLMGCFIGLAAIRQYLSGEFIPIVNVKRIEGYNAPLTANPNDLALMLNVILPLTFALLLAERRQPLRLFLMFAVAVQAGGVIASFSRGGFLGLMTIFLVTQWRFVRRGRPQWAMVTVFVVLLCIPLLPSGYMERIRSIGDTSADVTGSADVRWNDMIAARDYVLRNPLMGAGVGMGVLALNEERGKTWIQVHNVYLQYATDLGIPGLILFLILLGGCLRSTRIARLRSAMHPDAFELNAISEGIGVSLVGFAVSAFFHPVAYDFYFYYLAGLASASRLISERAGYAVGDRSDARALGASTTR